jgi:hypothetical protein
MELNKEPTYCNAMERFLFIAADNGILSMLSKIVLKEWLLLISDRAQRSDWP